MRIFDYSCIPQALLTPEIMNLVSAVHECRGRQELFLMAKMDVLETMVEVAKAHSTEASNKIEGIRTSDKRLREIMADETDLRTRDEEELAGYRDVLNLIHERYEFIEVTPNVILQLHQGMYRYTPSSMGGHFKIGDNEIRGIRADGTEYVRFRLVSAAATEDSMRNLCEAYRKSVSAESMDPLIAALLFVFDFICIHPFNDGNGRMSRLLTLLLLYKSGYLVGKYVSIEKEIERTKSGYYDALAESSEGWHEGLNNPEPFVRYMLGVILAAYRDFESRVSLVAVEKLSKAERVGAVVQSSIGKVTKADVLDACPDISAITVQRALSGLVSDGKVEKVGGGRSTGYVWVSLE